MKERVGVEQHDVAAQCLPHGDVVGAREAEIHRAADEADLRRAIGQSGLGKLAFHHLRRSVSGGIVHDQDFRSASRGETAALGQSGLETLAQQLARIKRDHDDGDFVFVGEQQLDGRGSLFVENGFSGHSNVRRRGVRTRKGQCRRTHGGRSH